MQYHNHGPDFDLAKTKILTDYLINLAHEVSLTKDILKKLFMEVTMYYQPRITFDALCQRIRRKTKGDRNEKKAFTDETEKAALKEMNELNFKIECDQLVTSMPIEKNNGIDIPLTLDLELLNHLSLPGDSTGLNTLNLSEESNYQLLDCLAAVRTTVEIDCSRNILFEDDLDIFKPVLCNLWNDEELPSFDAVE